MEELRVDGEDGDLLALDDFAHLRRREARVEVDDAEPGLGRGDGQLDEVTVIATGDADAFAASCPESVQALRKSSRLSIEVGVRQLAMLVDHGDAAGRGKRGRCVWRGCGGPPSGRCSGECRDASGIEQTRAADDVEQR